jgi:NADH-quinone oxidoreductase subunit F/NADP-reducing hydrogenase subunit HndC
LAVGAKQVFQALKEELARRGVSGVEVSLGGEWGLTAEEPLVVVKEDRRVTLYGNVNEEGARRIASEHLAAGKPVDQWLIELREVSK